MEALLFIAKYGVLLCGILAVLCSASKQVRQLALSFRHKNKFMQVLVFAWFVSLVVYGGSKPNADTDDSSQDSDQQEQSTKMPDGMVSTNINAQPQFMGGNVANTLNSTGQAQSTLPQWYVAKEYSTNDSDGDGIPDTWERWTHTKKLVNDALLDYDGDEVDNLTEFMHMCDPQRSDTDGDGIDDRIEIDGLLAGIEGLNPISKANYIVTEVDSNHNGIADLWDETNYHLFRDTDNDGYDDIYANNMPVESEYNFDVAVTISTTRTALLSSEYGSMLIAPCTNKVVKLRLSGDVDEGSISLSASPDGANVSGLWKARMNISFLPKYGQICEKNRIKLDNGLYVDFDEMTVDYVGILSTINRRNINNNSNGKILICYVPKFLKLYSNSESVCLLHGPDHDITLNISEELLPVFVSIGNTTNIVTESSINLLDVFNHSDLMSEKLTIHVFKEEEEENQYIETKTSQDFYLYLSTLCSPPVTNITGVADYRSSNYLNHTSHEPRIEKEIITFGSNCPTATNINAVIGFSHNKVNTRNLPIINTGDSRDSDTDHCIGVMYSPSLVILFDDFMEGFAEYKNKVYFKVNEIQMDSLLIGFDCLLEEFRPVVYYIEMCLNENEKILDRLWITIFIQDDLVEFNSWYSTNVTDLGWIAALPKPYRTIKNANGELFDPEPDNPGYWSEPSSINSYLHHNASYEMRTETTLTQGNQACYDVNGVIITDTIAAGTADRYAPYNSVGIIRPNTNHRKYDVYPFLRAIQLDGNPCVPDSNFAPRNLDRPCLYQGEYLNKYLQCRPTIQPEE